MRIAKTVGVSITLLLSVPTVNAQDALARFNEQTIRSFSPRAKPELVDALIQNTEVLRAAGITSDLRLSHLLAQFATETGGLMRLDENLNYSASRLVEVFSPSVITSEKAVELAGNPKEIANYIYGQRLGNCGRDTDDGWNYRGSGYIQLTGRTNFRKRGREIQLPLEVQPEIARKPEEGLRAALAYWTARNINMAADRSDARGVRVLVNGKAAHGYAASVVWLARAKRAFAPANESGAGHADDDLRSVEEILRELGFLDQSTESSASNSKLRSDALKKFQRQRGLGESGKLDEDTLYAITEISGRSLGEDTAIESSCLERGRKLELGAPARRTQAVESGALPAGKGGSGILSANSMLETQQLLILAKGKPAYPFYESGGTPSKPNTIFVPYSVFEPDTREIVQPTTNYPARTVVQIAFVRISDGSLLNCSGTLISRNVVLTAAHCVHEGGSDGAWHGSFLIYPARNGPQAPFGECRAKALFALDGWINPSFSGDRRLYDLGAIKLDCNVGDATGWLELRELPDGSNDTQTTIRGYPCDKTPVGRMYTSRDSIRAMQERKLFYQNDTFGCMSGSGVLDDSANIIGVHTNGAHGASPWATNNAGTRITTEVKQELLFWATE